MSGLSPRVVQEFCKLCDWAHQVWMNHRELFDKNPRALDLQKSMGGDALARLSIISHEYVLLQISKLHDPATVSGHITLGIDYVYKYGGWEPSLAKKLSDLSAQLDQFEKGLRTVRNRALAHNDLAAILSDSTLGGFEENDDAKYFQILQEFVDLVHAEVIGGPFPFNDLAKNDAIALLSILKP